MALPSDGGVGSQGWGTGRLQRFQNYAGHEGRGSAPDGAPLPSGVPRTLRWATVAQGGGLVNACPRAGW